jgi:hypothetical protein
MAKIKQKWVLYEYKNRNEMVILSKPFKSRKEAEKTRQKLSERERGRVGIGTIRTAV